MTMIIDQYGNKIEPKSLKTPQAVPSRTRKIGMHTSTSGLDPLKAARLLRSAEEGDTAAYLGIAEEMEEKYLHYAAQLATRKRAVASLKPEIVPASQDKRDCDIADFVRGQIPVIHAATIDLMDALGKGFSVCEILWDTSGKYWVPSELVWRDPRWFQFDKTDGKTLLLKSDNSPDGEPLDPGKYLIHMTRAKSGLPIRSGLARSAIWAFLFQNFAIRDWVTFIEQFGKPLRLGRYDAGAIEPADLDVLFEAVRSLGEDAAAILPRSMEIDFPEVGAARSNADLWRGLAEYLDRQVSKLVLGQTLTSETSEGGGGAYALGKIHNEIRLDILDDDAQSLARTINRDLIRLLVNLNFPNVTAFPEYELRVEFPEDLTAKVAIVEKAVAMGQPVPVAWFSETFGIPLPEDGEAVLGHAGVNMDMGAQAALRTANRPQDHFPDVRKMIAINKAETNGPDAAAKSVGRLMADTAPDMKDWLDTIEAMLDAAESLEEFQYMLATAFPKLDSEVMAQKLTDAFIALDLRGRFGARQ